MPIYTANPSRFDNVVIDRCGNSVSVNTGGAGNSRICITSLDLGMGYQQVVDNVPSYTFEDVPEKFQVTITAPNRVPYQHVSGIITGMGKDINSNIRIYPNPTYDLITFHAQGVESYSIKITSLNGHLLRSIDSAESELKIDLSHFQKGIYIITVGSGNYMRTEKIIKL